MKWKRLGEYYWSTEEGYKITKFRKGDEWKYSSFNVKGYFDYKLIGSLHNNITEAKEACEKYKTEKLLEC